MEVREGREAYYNIAGDILKESPRIFRVLSKTPTLILKTQMTEDYQKDYRSVLVRAIEVGRTYFAYLFSLPQTTEELT